MSNDNHYNYTDVHGNRHPASDLTREQVAEILHNYSQGFPQRQIASMLDLDISLVSKIIFDWHRSTRERYYNV